MEMINWGIIGCGDVTEKKSGPGFQKCNHSNLVAVMRRDAQKAQDYARRHNVPKWYDDAKKLIENDAVNAVYVATPPSTHKKYTIMALEAGKPVYVEKPMAMNYRECQEMVEAAGKFKQNLYVAYYRRAQPRFLQIKSLLTENYIGAIKSVCVKLHKKAARIDFEQKYHWRVDPEIGGRGGYFFDVGSHMLDIVEYLAGPIVSATGTTENVRGLYSVPDTFHAKLNFQNSAVGTCEWRFFADEPKDLIILEGEKGILKFTCYADKPIILRRKGKEEEYYIPQPEHVQQPLIQNVVNSLLFNETAYSTGETGAKTSLIMDWILG